MKSPKVDIVELGGRDGVKAERTGEFTVKCLQGGVAGVKEM
jgi:hypothetical protein